MRIEGQRRIAKTPCLARTFWVQSHDKKSFFLQAEAKVFRVRIGGYALVVAIVLRIEIGKGLQAHPHHAVEGFAAIDKRLFEDNGGGMKEIFLLPVLVYEAVKKIEDLPVVRRAGHVTGHETVHLFPRYCLAGGHAGKVAAGKKRTVGLHDIFIGLQRHRRRHIHCQE